MSRANRRRRARKPLSAAVQPLLRRALPLCLLAAVLAGGAVLANGHMRITDWEIKAPEAVRQEIEAHLQAWLKDNNDLWHSQPVFLRRMLLESMPDLADVNIQRSLDGHVRIAARMRRPVVIWQQASELWLVDEAGTPYRRLHKGEWPDLPLLRMEREGLADSLSLLASLQQLAPDRLARLSEVHDGGHYWKLILSHGEAWLLPKQQTARRMSRLVRILSQPRWRHRHFRVDARDARRWYLRTAKHEGVI